MQPTRTKHTLTLEAAQALVAAALAAAAERDLRIAVAVTDSEGALLSLARMDGVPAPIGEFCIEKAYTAAVTAASTRDFFHQIISTPSLQMGMTGRRPFLVWGGGVPACAQGVVVGAIGVSGGSEDDDIAIAGVALQACGLKATAAAAET